IRTRCQEKIMRICRMIALALLAFTPLGTAAQQPANQEAPKDGQRSQGEVERARAVRQYASKVASRNRTAMTFEVDRRHAVDLSVPARTHRGDRNMRTQRAITVKMRLLRWSFIADGSHTEQVLSSPSVSPLDGTRAN